jgi:hypothetical protein
LRSWKIGLDLLVSAVSDEQWRSCRVKLMPHFGARKGLHGTFLEQRGSTEQNQPVHALSSFPT